MDIRFKVLTLQCRSSRELIDLDHQVNIFHGKISAGKSSIVRLINFCLGGKLEKTPALQQEMISASLLCQVGKYEVLLERLKNANEIQTSWKDEDGNVNTILAPLIKRETPIFNDNIYVLSDLFYAFLDITPLKVRRNKTEEESPLISLSFRDIMWYCYLDQDKLDSSFFRLEDTYKRNKSRDVMRFIVGFYSQKLNQLEIDLDSKTTEKNGKNRTVEELNNILHRFGYDSTNTIEKEAQEFQSQFKALEQRKRKLEGDYKSETHAADSLRSKLIQLTHKLQGKEEIIYDLRYRIQEQTGLRSEIITSKYKLAKTESVEKVLSGVGFDSCPQCGTDVTSRVVDQDKCSLCLSDTQSQTLVSGLNPDAIRIDLDDRIRDLENSISNHERALNIEINQFQEDKKIKASLEEELQQMLFVYESKYLSNFRFLEKEAATVKEKINSQEKLKLIPLEINKLQGKIRELSLDIEELKEKIQREKENLNTADSYIKELEEIFLHFLNEVDLPGIGLNDEVHINRKTWDVSIFPNGEDYLSWNFFNAGSGGKKTLFNVCYALAVHTLASKNNLPLPRFLIIDTPMKNIGEDVNEDLFNNFYNLLYSLIANELADTQIVIIDKELFLPEDHKFDISHRFMTPSSEDSPPLIRYYRGA
ncbi:hypothetical protein [Lewinella sp. LCG006]|uniref:hypothetical protein n=1 Tax=Lewinella sp. LCG006 TaxID=3231911 RepID=UPI00345F76CF